MSPINPNFKPGVGHLVTDRFDFQKHIDGEDFRQAADTVDLVPPVVIGSTSITDVQTAIEALAGTIIVPFVPDATTVSKGIVQLAGDLMGSGTTAASPKVAGIQGFPVSSTSPSTNNVLQWNGTNWAPAVLVNATSSVFGTLKLLGDLNGGTAGSPVVTGIQTRQVSAVAPLAGQALVWNGSAWTPTGIPATPSGTGFATLTSGTFDASATTNIRYAGGRLQTDVSIQYKNGAIVGDLAWVPAGTNKTITLPDITDVVVTRTNTETLTNKTINATDNTITDTGAALGDILAIVSGTKFTRLTKGANGTFLGVSAGVLGYYTPSGSTPSGTGFATVTSGVFDAAATANIRYTGGKLQSDTSIQYKNSTITGDLAWLPTGTNKTITLPNASDTLVGIATTDVLLNKTINATNNTITDTSTATGDILVSNGTKFVRRVKGANGTFWGVSGGVAGYYSVGSFPTITNSTSGTQNDVTTLDGGGSPAGTIIFDSSNSSLGLTGLAGGTDGRMLTLVPMLTGEGSEGIILYDSDPGSSANNQFSLYGEEIIIPNNSACIVQYETVNNKWRIVGEPVQNVVFPSTYNQLTITGLTTNGINVGSGANSNSGIFWNELTTTTTSPTVLNAYVTMPLDGTIRVEATVVMTRRTDATKAGIYKRVACWRRNNGASIAVGSVVTPYADQETTAGDDVTIISTGVNGGDIKVQVTAADTDERLWWIKYEYMMADAD